MRIEHIRSFVAVAEEASFTNAAGKLFLTQPVVTRHVATLESELRVQLFERTTKRVIVTHEGEVFLAAAIKILALLDESIAEISSFSRASSQSLTIGFNYLFIDKVTPPLLDAFVIDQADPISVQITEADPLTLIKKTQEGHIDGAFVGVTGFDYISEVLSYIQIGTRDEIILVGKQHPLAGREYLTVEDIKNYDFVYPFIEPSVVLSPARRELADRGYAVHVEHTEFESSALKIVERGKHIIDVPSEYRYSDSGVVAIPYRSDYVINVCFIWNPRTCKVLVKELVSFLARGLV